MQRGEIRLTKSQEQLREEVLRLNQERRVTIANLFEKMEKLRHEMSERDDKLGNTLSRGLEDIHRTLGRLEGRIELTKNHSSK